MTQPLASTDCDTVQIAQALLGRLPGEQRAQSTEDDRLCAAAVIDADDAIDEPQREGALPSYNVVGDGTGRIGEDDATGEGVATGADAFAAGRIGVSAVVVPRFL